MKLMLVMINIIMLSSFTGLTLYRDVTIERLYTGKEEKFHLGIVVFNVKLEDETGSYCLYPVVKYEEKAINKTRHLKKDREMYWSTGMNGLDFTRFRNTLQNVGIIMNKGVYDKTIGEFISINPTSCRFGLIVCYILTNNGEIIQITLGIIKDFDTSVEREVVRQVKLFIDDFRKGIFANYEETLNGLLGQNNLKQEKSLFLTLKLYYEDEKPDQQQPYQMREIEHHFQRNLHSMNYCLPIIKYILAQKKVAEEYEAPEDLKRLFVWVEILKFDTSVDLAKEGSTQNLGFQLRKEWYEYMNYINISFRRNNSLSENYYKSLFVEYINGVFFGSSKYEDHNLNAISKSLDTGELNVSYDDLKSLFDDRYKVAEYYLSNISEFNSEVLRYLNESMHSSFRKIINPAKRKLGKVKK
jgi:hypothetical protein